MEVWIVFIVGACLAGFVQGLTGFAFALIAMSFWVWILAPQLSAPLVVFASLWCHIISLSKEQTHYFDRSIVLVYIIAGLLGVPFGTYLLDIVDADFFKLLLGLFLIIWAPTMYFAPSLDLVKKSGTKADGLIGFLGGALGGLGGFCGALPSAWLMLKQFPKEKQRYILRHFNFAIQLFTIMVYLWQSTIRFEYIQYMLILMIAVSFPAILGAKLFYKISEQQFKKIVLSLLFLSGCVLTFTSIHRYLV